MNLKELSAIMGKFAHGVFATVDENGYPDMRGWELQFEKDGKLYFTTSSEKSVYRQMVANPKVAYTCDVNGYHVRISGTAVIVKDAAEKEEIYREIFERTIAPAPGLVDFLKSLKSEGFKTAVGSSGNTPNVNFVLSKCGITPYFDAIANGDMITHGKPDPEVYLLAAKKLGLDPAECIVAEDAPVGIEAARRAGCAVVAIASTFDRSALFDYDLLIDNFTQISTDDLRKLRN